MSEEELEMELDTLFFFLLKENKRIIFIFQENQQRRNAFFKLKFLNQSKGF
jgi:hypothetical protein